MTQRLPDIPMPPHDPLHFLLDARALWRERSLKEVEFSPDGALQLAPLPEVGQPLADGSAGLGGLAEPAGIAVDAEGGVILLDAASARLLRHDPCSRRFEEVPCIGGVGSGPRQLKDPHGIALFGGDLFVCDTGNHRIQVFGLKGMVLRAIWPSPPAAKLPETWEPYAIAFDGCGRVFVTDRANGVVHRFDRRGCWRAKFGALDRPTSLAIGVDGRIYVVQQDNGEVAAFSAEGQLLGTVPPPETEPAPVAVGGVAADVRGDFYVGRAAALKRYAQQAGQFRLAGIVPLPGAAAGLALAPDGSLIALLPAERLVLQMTATAHAREGTYLSQPLDSRLYQCAWHRVVLCGTIPKGTQVRVESFTAETLLDPADLDDDATRWTTHPVAAGMQQGEWDCLIASPPGRYLWLRLKLTGAGTSTPRLDRVKVYYPRLSLGRYLPAVFGAEPHSADFTDRMLAVFDTLFRSAEARLDGFARYLDPMAAPGGKNGRSDWLAWLASWMGLALDRSWDVESRRRWLREAHVLFHLRGTAAGLRRHLLLYLGWDSGGRDGHELVLEHFRLRRWLFVGRGRLGEEAVLWGEGVLGGTELSGAGRLGSTRLRDPGDPRREPFDVHAHRFTVFVPQAALRDPARRAVVDRLVSLNKPAHTAHRIEAVEPRFRIGVQSSVGLNTVVGRYPAGFHFETGGLGRATVLAEAAGGTGPGLHVGTASRVGASTVLD
jgi:phage tail-like protein